MDGVITSLLSSHAPPGMEVKGGTRMPFQHLKSVRKYVSHHLDQRCAICPGDIEAQYQSLKQRTLVLNINNTGRRESAQVRPRCGITTRSSNNATPLHTVAAWAMPIGSKAERIAKELVSRQTTSR